ncbi:hypothetical protein [Methanosphaera cuniculi]|uniref:hypothetical protein n=1 Tax=Methanosphaera cuniculi TaxID=1077256 RepID=UPI0026F2C8CA|nr:hypothetical protein [Methanosphaera cuniculi]
MNKNTKILLILIIIILIPIVYFTATTMSNQMEQDNFYETIKNVSNNENNSDKSISQLIQTNNNNDNDTINVYTKTSKTLNESIKTLTDLEESLHNETLKEYVNLEITRMEDEEKYWEAYIEYIQTRSNTKEVNDKGIIITHSKQNAADFLNKHPDIKTRFEKMGIDEDFMIVENAEVDKKIGNSKK